MSHPEFLRRKTAMRVFFGTKNTRIAVFLLKERISSGFARANLNSQPKSTTIWAFDRVKRPNCCAFWLRIQISSGKARANSLFEEKNCNAGVFRTEKHPHCSFSPQKFGMTHV